MSALDECPIWLYVRFINNGDRQMNVSWNTTKTAEGYKFTVYHIVPRTEPNEKGHYADTVTLNEGICKTRAKASGLAKRWTLYHKRTAA